VASCAIEAAADRRGGEYNCNLLSSNTHTVIKSSTRGLHATPTAFVVEREHENVAIYNSSGITAAREILDLGRPNRLLVTHCEWKQRCPTVPWRKIIGLRNLLAHGYWVIDVEELWDVARNKVRSSWPTFGHC
jgi:hypothetical protein